MLRFEASEDNEDGYASSYENIAVFIVGSFQYLWSAIIFSKGAPYRLSIFSNCIKK